MSTCHRRAVYTLGAASACCLVVGLTFVFLPGKPLPLLDAAHSKLPHGWAWDTYHSHEELAGFMRWINDTYSNVAHVYSIGQSVQGRELLVVQLSGKHSAYPIWSKKPKVKMVGGIHGNEQANREVLLRLVHHLADRYGHDDRVTALLDSTGLFILPSMNPDGYENNTRHNANGYDLNRNFPLDSMPYDAPGPASDQDSGTVKSWRATGAGQAQPEVQAVMDWSKQHHFILSASLHQGALVANYPHDACDTQVRECPTQDEPLPRFLAKVYAQNHPLMRQNNKDMFVNGTVQGAEWYTLLGGMQDWVFFDRNSLELTMELHEVMRPQPQELPAMWEHNLPPLMRYMEMGQMGMHGRVVDAETFMPLQGRIDVISPQHHRPTDITDKDGQFFMLLAPDVLYCLKIHALYTHLSKDSYYTINVSVLRLGAQKMIHGMGVRGLTERHLFFAERVYGHGVSGNNSTKAAERAEQQHQLGKQLKKQPGLHHHSRSLSSRRLGQWQQLQRQQQQSAAAGQLPASRGGEVLLGEATAGMCGGIGS